MANERLYQFPSKAAPIPADIIYVGDSANAFNEVQSTIAQIIAAYPNLSAYAALTLGANSYAYTNGSSVLTAGTITAGGVAILAVTLANNAVLMTDNSGNVTFGATLPAAVQANITALGAQSQILNMNTHQISNVVDPTHAQDAATQNYVSTQLGSYLPLAGGTMSGAIAMGGFKISNAADPTLAQDLCTKNYVDNIATGGGALCVAATTTALTVTYSNGTAGVGATLTNAGAQTTFTIDGQSPSVGQRVLIKNQASSLQNGVYTVTNVGSGATNWILTRATDYDTVADINDTGIIPVQSGTANANTGWYNTTTMVAVGTTAITFIQFGVVVPSTSTAGLALLSTGSGNSSAWSNSPPITRVVVQTFTSSGTYTPTTGMSYCTIECLGSGAGGGGTANSAAGASAQGGGGGAGSYARKTVAAATIGVSQTVTVGNAGTGGASGNNNGNPGNDVSVGSICIGKGGSGGTGSNGSAPGSGGAGGVAGTGDFTPTGANGSTGQSSGASNVAGYFLGFGGGTQWGSGGMPSSAPTTGANATGYGCGGAGGSVLNAGGAAAGGNGSKGIVVITEYVST